MSGFCFSEFLGFSFATSRPPDKEGEKISKKKKHSTHRVDSARGVLLEDGLDDLVDLGHAGHAPDEEDLAEKGVVGV